MAITDATVRLRPISLFIENFSVYDWSPFLLLYGDTDLHHPLHLFYSLPWILLYFLVGPTIALLWDGKLVIFESLLSAFFHLLMFYLALSKVPYALEKRTIGYLYQLASFMSETAERFKPMRIESPSVATSDAPSHLQHVLPIHLEASPSVASEAQPTPFEVWERIEDCSASSSQYRGSIVPLSVTNAPPFSPALRQQSDEVQDYRCPTWGYPQ